MPHRRRPPAVALLATALLAGLLAFLPGAASGAPAAPAAPAQVAPVELQLLGINDFHGRLEPPTPGPPPVGGAAQLAGLVDQLRAANPNTAFVAAGDNVGASTFVSAIDGDNPTIDALTAAGLDVSAVGNHELDKGFADLRDRIVPRAGYGYLAANLYEGGVRPFDAYRVQDIGGVDVGFVGVITQETESLVNPDGIAGLTFTDPVDEAEAVAAQLKDGDPGNGEADVVVLLAHEGAATSTSDVASLVGDRVFGRFATMSDDVDVIFSGHTHQSYALLGPSGDGAGTRPLVQTGDYGEELGRVTLTYDPASGAVSNPTAELLPVSDVAPNAQVAQIVADAKERATELGAQPLGSITADIKRDPARATESVGANFIADVQLDATAAPGRGGAQLALMNPGGVREDFLYAPDGVVTYEEAFKVQSFSNDVFTKTYTGAEIKAVLEQQWQPATASRPILWLGVSRGFTYEWIADAPQGSHIVASSMALDGVPIDPAGTYRVTVNSFLAAGGDNFSVLGGGTDSTTTGDNDLQMLIDHFAANSPVTADTAKRTFEVTDEPEEPTTTTEPSTPSTTTPSTPVGPEPFATYEALVRRQFDDVLGREPSATELATWVADLTAGRRTVGDLVATLLGDDLTSTEARLVRLYEAFFGRPPDASGLAYWTARLDAGTSLGRVADQFARSSEFATTYGDLDDGAFVDLVYRNVLDREAEPAGRAGWVARLGSGRWTRGQLMTFFSESSEHRRLTAPLVQVVALYRVLLDRLPTDGELDAAVATIRTGSATVATTATAIVAGAEYRTRIG